MELFEKTKILENKIQIFLENIRQASTLFTQAFQCYFNTGISATFLNLQDKINTMEKENDSLRREVENQLYAQMLLPDMRSDILGLVEGCDKIINKYQIDLALLAIEQPKTPRPIQKEIMDLIETNIRCVDILITGIQEIMRGKNGGDFIQEVYRLEHQVDLQAVDLKQIIFQKIKLPLARQLQLKEFIYAIEKISDMAEDMADIMSVFVVKHAI